MQCLSGVYHLYDPSVHLTFFNESWKFTKKTHLEKKRQKFMLIFATRCTEVPVTLEQVQQIA